jgi:hypothetical protein
VRAGLERRRLGRPKDRQRRRPGQWRRSLGLVPTDVKDW